MKIWVLVPDYGQEGYGEPIRAYTSEVAAKADLKKRGQGSNELFDVELHDDVQE